MASITNSSGRRTIQFVGADGKRRSIRLGKMDGRSALGVKLHVDHLVQSKFSGMPLHIDTAGWLGNLDDTLHGRLSKVGLCQPRLVGLRGHMPLAKMIDDYIARRTDLKPETLKAHRQARDKLVGFFGESKPIGSITAAEASDFKRARRKHDSVAYVSKQIQLARQFFKDAVERELLNRNPFAQVKGGSQKNPARQCFVARKLVERAMDKALDLEWKLIIAFSRYGGMRVPSEALALRWSDINWDTNRIRIRASKTEHHVGREERDVPLFPELRPLLLQARAAAEPGAVYVITRYRSPASNLRTQFLRILDAAGVAPWPKLFQNMRSTRQTELTEVFPTHVVCAWLGNTEKIAQGHYLQVTSAHFDRATGAKTGAQGDGGMPENDRRNDGDGNDDGGGESSDDDGDRRSGGRSKHGAKGGAKSGAAPAGLASHGAAPRPEAVSIKADAAAACEVTRAAADICSYIDMGAVGFEPTKA